MSVLLFDGLTAQCSCDRLSRKLPHWTGRNCPQTKIESFWIETSINLTIKLARALLLKKDDEREMYHLLKIIIRYTLLFTLSSFFASNYFLINF